MPSGELAEKVREMIRAEREMTNIPTCPPADFSAMQRRDVPAYGTPSSELEALDRKRQQHFAKVKTAEAASRIAERHIKREGSMYSQLQPIKPPYWEDLVDKRIDVLFEMEYTRAKRERTRMRQR